MVYVDMGGQSQQHSCIGVRIWQICAELLTSALAMLCLTQGAVSAGYQDELLWQSTTPNVAVRFTPSGGVIALSEDGTVTLWNGDTRRPMWKVNFGGARRENDYTRIKARAMDLSPDGRMAVVAYIRYGVDRSLIDEKAGDPTKQKDAVSESHIVLIDATDGAIKKDIKKDIYGTGDSWVRSVVFASSGKYFFVATPSSIDRTLIKHQSPTSTTYVLSLDTGQVLRSFRSQGWIVNATISPDDRRFAAAASALHDMEGDTAFYELQFYDANTGGLLRSSKFETTETAAISFSSDGSLLAVSRSARNGLQIDLVTTDGAEKRTHLIKTARYTESRAVAFIGEQHRIVLASGRLQLAGHDCVGTPRFNDQGGAVLVVDQGTGEKLRTFKFKSFVTCLAVSRDGLKIAAGMHNGRIAIKAVL